jgi:hypothetical protein
MPPKLVLVAFCTMVLTGCAQFKDSFGELRDPAIYLRPPYSSDSLDWTRPNDHPQQGSDKEEMGLLLTALKPPGRTAFE